MGMLKLNNKLIRGQGSPFPVEGLTSYWRFDETSGNVADSKGGITGTASNLTYQQTGIKNYGVKFNNTNSKIDIGTTYNYERTQAFSISCWIKRTGVSAWTVLWGSYGISTRGKEFIFDTTNRFYISLTADNGTAISKQSVAGTVWDSTSIWYHVVFTYAGNSLAAGMNVYINNIAVVFDAPLSDNLNSTTVTTNPFLIGSRNGTYGLNSIIDEVGIWNRVLTQAEVTALYNSGNGLFY